jgi:hypothetical protein
MSRQDTVVGFYNYPVPTTTATTETILLAPSASGVYAGLPSPTFPLTTTTYPCGLNIAPPPDVVLGTLDGRPFEIFIAGKLTTTATTSFTINLYQYTAAALGSPSGAAYRGASTTGTGVTKLVTGTATAVGSGGASTNFTFRQQYIWDSVSKTLAAANAPATFQAGVTVANTQSAATVASLAETDLNFAPSFTYSATNSPVLLLTDFVINRI